MSKIVECLKKSVSVELTAGIESAIEKERDAFEAWITSPPYEHGCDRNGENSAFPKQYKRHETQLAWEAWLASKGLRCD